MDKSIFELLTKMMSQNGHNQSQTSYQNPAANNYPPEASINQTSMQQQNNSPVASLFSLTQDNSSSQNNLLPLIMSFLGKGGTNPLADILAQSNKKEEEISSPKNEILL